MRKVLIMEDEENIRSFVVINLKRAGYQAVEAATGQEALDKLRENPDIGVAILDIMLPDIDGFEVCRRIRATNKQMGIIMLTARTQEMDKVTGLMTGADDYVTKPFELEILASRIRALLRRAGQNPKEEEGILRCGQIRLDEGKTAVFCGQEEIGLSRPEYGILLILMKNRGRTVTRRQLLEQVWDSEGNFVNDNTLTVTMKRLREKLHNPACLKTIRSFGYRMEDV